MSWLVVGEGKREFVYQYKPSRHTKYKLWVCCGFPYIELPKGSIKKLIGINLTWDDEPVEI